MSDAGPRAAVRHRIAPRLPGCTRPAARFAARLAALALGGALLAAPFAHGDDSPQSAAQAPQDAVSETVLKTATAIDNFFSTEARDWHANETRLRLRTNLDWVGGHGTDFKPKLELHLALPALNDRLSLVVNEGDDDAFRGRAADEDESNLALRYIVEAADQWSLDFDLGVTTRGDPAVQGFGRANLARRFTLADGQWGAHAQNRLYRYTSSGWRNDFSWYFERVLSNRLFFRSRTRLDYQQDKNRNVLPEQRFTLYQQISRRTALAWEAIAREVFYEDTAFDDNEIKDDCESCKVFQLRLRLRRGIPGHPRFFYEIWPIASWPQQRDYAFTPALRLRFEVLLGDLPAVTKLN